MICFIFASVGTASRDLSEVLAEGDNPWKKMKPRQMCVFAVSACATASLSYLAFREYSKRMEEEDAESLLKDQA